MVYVQTRASPPSPPYAPWTGYREIAAGLLALKNRIEAAKIPPSKVDETINLAVWNIREFGKVRRTEPAIHYIAEILGQFDLIAIVELRDNLEDLSRVPCFLGQPGESFIRLDRRPRRQQRVRCISIGPARRYA